MRPRTAPADRRDKVNEMGDYTLPAPLAGRLWTSTPGARWDLTESVVRTLAIFKPRVEY